MDNIRFENCRILFRNLSGKPDQYNRDGKRSFCVLLEPEFAEVLKADGWNVKYLRPRDPEDEPAPYLNVAVSYKNVAPKIWMVTSKGRTLLNENNVGNLDYVEVKRVDLVVSPYVWDLGGGNHGIKAYAKTMYVTIKEDPFEELYYDIPDNTEAEELPFE